MGRAAVLASVVMLSSLAVGQDSIRWKPWMERERLPDIHPYAGPNHTVKSPELRKNLLRSHVVIEFAATPSEKDLSKLRGRGGVILRALSERAFAASVPNGFSFAGLNLSWEGRFRGRDKISRPATGRFPFFVVEFYPDVDMGDAREIAIETGLRVIDNPDLLPHDLLLEGSAEELASLAAWDEVEYAYPASGDLVRGLPVNACAGALTSLGNVSSGVPTFGDGWDGPGLGAASLYYAFSSVTSKLASDTAKAEIVRAYSQWAAVAKLTFTASSNTMGSQTVTVLFASGAHGDPYPFDGPGGVLAHTFYPYPLNPEPIAGDMHFDSDESWKIGADTDLFSVALHETGHALGLGHSANPADVMYPYYRRLTGLSTGDVAAVLTLYAPQDNASSAPVPTPLSIAVQSAASPVTTASVALGGTVTGGVGDVQVSWRNGSSSGVMLGTRAWTAVVPLSNGANSIVITAQDAQKTTASETVNVTRQSQAGPDTAIQIASPAASGTYSTGSASLTISGTASDSSGVDRVAWTNARGGNGLASGTTVWSTGPVALSSGQNPFTVTAYGRGGGTASKVLTVNYTPASAGPDKTAPSLTILSPGSTNVSTSNASIVFTGTASDNVGVVSVTWGNSNGSSGIATGTVSWTTAPIPLYVGANMITIRASDAAGNVGWRSVLVTRSGH